MKNSRAGSPRGWTLVVLAMTAALALLTAAVQVGCGDGAGPGPTAGATSTTVEAGATVGTDTTSASAGNGATDGTGVTAAPPTSGANQPTTTIFTGTTGPGGGTRSLTFVGAVSAEIWQALRATVVAAAGDGDKVLAGVAKLSVGPAVDVGVHGLDALSGIGFSAGADTSQPIAVAADADGTQVLVFAYWIAGKADSSTIVGFAADTRHVILVAGPLPISDSTQNITTVPGQ